MAKEIEERALNSDEQIAQLFYVDRESVRADNTETGLLHAKRM